MASTKMKIKKSKSGGYEVMVLAKHPMETGLRKDKKTGNKIPEHFIENMEFSRPPQLEVQACRMAGPFSLENSIVFQRAAMS